MQSWILSHVVGYIPHFKRKWTYLNSPMIALNHFRACCFFLKLFQLLFDLIIKLALTPVINNAQFLVPVVH